VAVCFGVRCVDLLGHRPRLDACVGCGRPYPFVRPHLDFDGGGLVCEGCEREASAAVSISATAVTGLERLRSLRWEEAIRAPLARVEAELAAVLDAQVSRLIGEPTRTPRFVREVRRLSPGGRG
jgi:recombinational DNA repair protein (RecF pathway)